MDYKKAINQIIERRKTEQYNGHVLFLNAMNENPLLKECETNFRKAILESIKSGKENKDEISRLEKEKAQILKKMGITLNQIEPPPHCKTCADTGLNNGKVCDCVKALAINSENNIKIPLRDFAESDFTVYDKEYALISQKVFGDVKKIMALYPENKKRTITLMGPTGTGKTFLAGCCAKFISEKGLSVTAVSAFDFNNRCLGYHTTFDDKKMDFLNPVLDSSLLIIDDLGTESVLKNITLEYLFLVISERLNNDKLTFITTNLNADGILNRYGERLYSRLFAKNTGYYCTLFNSDLRKLKTES